MFTPVSEWRRVISALRWRHNERDSVSHHQPHGCLFTQRFIVAQIKENIKGPRYWLLCGEFTGTGEFPAQKASYAEKCFHLMTSSWERDLTRPRPRCINSYYLVPPLPHRCSNPINDANSLLCFILLWSYYSELVDPSGLLHWHWAILRLPQCLWSNSERYW